MKYTLIDTTTGEILRQGSCGPADFAVLTVPGRKAFEGHLGDDIEDVVVVPADGSKPFTRKRPAAEIDARRPKTAVPIDQMDILVDVLKKKGVVITRSDLMTSVADLRAAKANPKGP